jgi:hypothetical protein
MLPRPTKERFLAAIQRMLRPVVRQLIAYGISYPAVVRMLRQLYVEVAEQDFALPFKRQTDSRLALMTGINRREVSQVRRRKPRDEAPIEVEDTAITHVIGRWMSTPSYAHQGDPRRIPYESADPEAASFTRLVRDLGVDIPPRSILDELIRTEAVELLPNGDVVLHQEAYVPPADAEGKLSLLGSDPGELFTTIVHNIEHAEDPRLQRKVVYDNVGADALAQLRAEARKVGEEFVRRANALLSSYDRDRNPNAPGGRRARVVLGAYYFEEDVARVNQGERSSVKPPPGRIRRSR